MNKHIATTTATFALLMSSGTAFAQEQAYGKAEYINSCAACHGPDAKGDGPMADVLMRRPPDLTVLAEKNGGEFPYNKVFAVIDGRFIVPGHGERDMPIWGRQFFEEDAKAYGPNGGEIVAQERIHELANYLGSLQK